MKLVTWPAAVLLFVVTVPFALAGIVARVCFEAFRKGWTAGSPR